MSTFFVPEALAGRAKAGALSHAYILTGPDREARRQAAVALAAAYLCTTPEACPCGACKGCRKVEKGIHPDVIWTAPEPGKDLKVDQIRDLRGDVYIRPNEGGRKVYILEDAHRMNPSAQNAFLKVLEDGPAYAAFLLLSPNDAALLPTIRSRSETLRVPPLPSPASPSPPPPPSLERKAGELAGLLLTGDRWGLVNWCVGYERGGREEVLSLWEETRKALLTYRNPSTTAKAVALIEALEEILAAGEQNANIGALWGWLWAEAR